MSESYFNKFILFCCGHGFYPFKYDASVVVAFAKDCVHDLNKASAVFRRHDVIVSVLRGVDLLLQADLLVQPEIVELLDVIQSLDHGFDSKLGTKTHRAEILELMPLCKYTKHALKSEDENFWMEFSVQLLLQGVFPKKVFRQSHGLTPKMAAVIFGVSLEMVMAHNPWLERPEVSFPS